MKVTSSLRRSDPQQSNELPVGRSALIFLKGFVFEPLDVDLDYFWLADQPLRTALRFDSSGGVIIGQSAKFESSRRSSVADARSFLVALWRSC